MVHPSKVKITGIDLHKAMHNHRTPTDKENAAVQYVLNKFNCDVNQEEIRTFLKEGFLAEYFPKIKKARRKISAFLEANDEWLSDELSFPESCFLKVTTDAKAAGRPSKSFKDSSVRSKRRKTLSIRENYSLDELVNATETKLREVGDRSTAALLHECRSTTPTRALRIMRKWKRVEKVPTKLSDDEAWALIRRLKLSVRTYKELRKVTLSHGHNVFPHYTGIADRQKMLKQKNRTGTDYEDIINDALKDHDESDGDCQESAENEHVLGIEDKSSSKKRDNTQENSCSTKEQSSNIRIPENTTKEELIKSSSEIDPRVVQFPVAPPTKIECAGMQVPANQNYLTGWPMNSFPTSSNYTCNGTEFFN